MKIESIRIQNFRTFRDVTVALDDYTCLVGANGAGKSTVLQALNVFFREMAPGGSAGAQLGPEDFHGKDTSIPIEITVTFGSLDEDAKNDFKHYVRQDRLVVSARVQFDPTQRSVNSNSTANDSGWRTSENTSKVRARAARSRT